jgi:hypothetical protein
VVVLLGGRVAHTGSYQQLLSSGVDLSAFLPQQQQEQQQREELHLQQQEQQQQQNSARPDLTPNGEGRQSLIKLWAGQHVADGVNSEAEQQQQQQQQPAAGSSLLAAASQKLGSRPGQTALSSSSSRRDAQLVNGAANDAATLAAAAAAAAAGGCVAPSVGEAVSMAIESIPQQQQQQQGLEGVREQASVYGDKAHATLLASPKAAAAEGEDESVTAPLITAGNTSSKLDQQQQQQRPYGSSGSSGGGRSKGQLVLAEGRAVGQVKRSVYLAYLTAMGAFLIVPIAVLVGE